MRIDVTGDCIHCGETVTAVHGKMPRAHQGGRCVGPVRKPGDEWVRGETIDVPVEQLFGLEDK